MISKYCAVGIVALLAGASFTAILAQNDALSVASGHREILYRLASRGMARRTHTIPRASRNSQRSS
jgi:hypothetical protein